MRRWFWGSIIAVLAGCGGTPGGGEPSGGPDRSGAFVGAWFGRSDTQFRDASGPVSERTAVVGLTVTGTGKNRLRMPNFCGTSDTGPEATVDSDTTFTLAPYSCEQSFGSCTGVVSIVSGGGSVSGTTLTFVASGHSDQRASGSCRASSVDFTLTATLTRDDPRQAHLPAIGGASVEMADFFGEFRVHWNPPGSASELFPVYVEWQVAGPDGVWQGFDLHDNEDGRSGTVILNAVELEVFRFRVRATNGFAAGPFSQELPITTGFYSPSPLNGFQQLEQVRLTWTDPQRPQATSLQIERGEPLADGGVAYSTVANVASPAMEYVDTLPGEGGRFMYRSRWVSPALRGYPNQPWVFAQAPLFAPDGLVLAADAAGVDLQWTNHSLLATELLLSRGSLVAGGPPDLLVHLPPSTTAYRDTVPSPGAYRYSLQAVSAAIGVSATVSGLVAMPMDPALGLDSSILQIPYEAIEVRRDSSGHWYYVAGGALVKTADPSWTPHPVAQDWRVRQPMQIDPLNRPHLLSLHPASTGTATDLVHEWFDGSWHSETVASLELSATDLLPFEWQLDGSAKPVVVTSIATDSTGLRVVRWAGSSYSVESPSAGVVPVEGLHGMAIAVAPDGRILVAVSGTQGLLVLERAGSWGAKALAISIAAPDLDLLAGASTVDLLARHDGLDGEAFVLHRSGSTWAAPEAFPRLCCGAPVVVAASTASGTRPAALLMGAVDGVLLAKGDDGWSTTPLGLGAYLRSFGYDPAGKMYALLILDANIQTQTLLELHER